MVDKKKSINSYYLNTIDEIKGDIYTYGSVTAAFLVYEDFLTYKAGVYRHVTGKSLGGHAIKIIGWGVDHWICINSWNESWGDKGTFRIAFRECGIDS
jgi:cathepsin B